MSRDATRGKERFEMKDGQGGQATSGKERFEMKDGQGGQASSGKERFERKEGQGGQASKGKRASVGYVLGPKRQQGLEMSINFCIKHL